MQLTALALVAGAIGAAAHPNHAHYHRGLHEKRDEVHYKAVHKTLIKPVTTVATTTSTPAPVATPTSSKVAAVVAAAATSSVATTSGTGSSTYVAFCGGATKRQYVEMKRATAAEIAYTGNTGTANDWGCNIMEVASSIAHLYDYTTAYTNVDTKSYQVICFNKIGATGLINGFDGGIAVSFTLAPGATQHVAFEANSQGACAFAPGSVPTDSYGAWGGTWVEFDFDNTSNGGWSGLDCSSLVAQAAGLSVPGCQVCVDGSATCSAILPGGVGVNGYVAGTEAEDGIGINQPAGAFTQTVKVGYSG